jgi:hypothetical protein
MVATAAALIAAIAQPTGPLATHEAICPPIFKSEEAKLFLAPFSSALAYASVALASNHFAAVAAAVTMASLLLLRLKIFCNAVKLGSNILIAIRALIIPSELVKPSSKAERNIWNALAAIATEPAVEAMD